MLNSTHSLCFFSLTSFKFNIAGVWDLIFITLSHTQTHVKRSSGVYSPCHNSQSETVSLHHTSQNDKFQIQLRREKGGGKLYKKHGRLSAILLNNLMVFTFFFSLYRSSFNPCASSILSGVPPTRKTSGPRPCGDGPDEARKTLMFIRQSLNRFHRCQSGKVTVTAPIRETG